MTPRVLSTVCAGLTAIAVLLSTGPALAKKPATTAAAEPTIDELLNRADDLMRGASSHGTVTMQVKTARFERTMKMEMYSKGSEKTLIRILAPAKDKGMSTLKVDKNIWNYLPKIDRTIKVPAAMMSGAWMGSHFSNDDLVRESRYTEDFSCGFETKPKDGKGHYVIACIPKPDAPVVWGKVVMKIAASNLIADEVTFFDEKGVAVRTITYSEVVELGGRLMPRRMRMEVADKPGEYTMMTFDEMAFDIDIPDRQFSLQALKK